MVPPPLPDAMAALLRRLGAQGDLEARVRALHDAVLTQEMEKWPDSGGDQLAGRAAAAVLEATECLLLGGHADSALQQEPVARRRVAVLTAAVVRRWPCGEWPAGARESASATLQTVAQALVKDVWSEVRKVGSKGLGGGLFLTLDAASSHELWVGLAQPLESPVSRHGEGDNPSDWNYLEGLLRTLSSAYAGGPREGRPPWEHPEGLVAFAGHRQQSVREASCTLISAVVRDVPSRRKSLVLYVLEQLRARDIPDYTFEGILAVLTQLILDAGEGERRVLLSGQEQLTLDEIVSRLLAHPASTVRQGVSRLIHATVCGKDSQISAWAQASSGEPTSSRQPAAAPGPGMIDRILRMLALLVHLWNEHHQPSRGAEPLPPIESGHSDAPQPPASPLRTEGTNATPTQSPISPFRSYESSPPPEAVSPGGPPPPPGSDPRGEHASPSQGHNSPTTARVSWYLLEGILLSQDLLLGELLSQSLIAQLRSISPLDGVVTTRSVEHLEALVLSMARQLGSVVEHESFEVKRMSRQLLQLVGRLVCTFPSTDSLPRYLEGLWVHASSTHGVLSASLVTQAAILHTRRLVENAFKAHSVTSVENPAPPEKRLRVDAFWATVQDGLVGDSLVALAYDQVTKALARNLPYSSLIDWVEDSLGAFASLHGIVARLASENPVAGSESDLTLTETAVMLIALQASVRHSARASSSFAELQRALLPGLTRHAKALLEEAPPQVSEGPPGGHFSTEDLAQVMGQRVPSSEAASPAPSARTISRWDALLAQRIHPFLPGMAWRLSQCRLEPEDEKPCDVIPLVATLVHWLWTTVDMAEVLNGDAREGRPPVRRWRTRSERGNAAFALVDALVYLAASIPAAPGGNGLSESQRALCCRRVESSLMEPLLSEREIGLDDEATHLMLNGLVEFLHRTGRAGGLSLKCFSRVLDALLLSVIPPEGTVRLVSLLAVIATFLEGQGHFPADASLYPGGQDLTRRSLLPRSQDEHQAAVSAPGTEGGSPFFGDAGAAADGADEEPDEEGSDSDWDEDDSSVAGHQATAGLSDFVQQFAKWLGDLCTLRGDLLVAEAICSIDEEKHRSAVWWVVDTHVHLQ